MRASPKGKNLKPIIHATLEPPKKSKTSKISEQSSMQVRKHRHCKITGTPSIRSNNSRIRCARCTPKSDRKCNSAIAGNPSWCIMACHGTSDTEAPARKRPRFFSVRTCSPFPFVRVWGVIALVLSFSSCCLTLMARIHEGSTCAKIAAPANVLQ